MQDHVYKLVEVIGTSQTTIEDAVQNAVAKAARSLHHMRWFQVVDTRGTIEDGKIGYWQVTLKIGFTLD